MGAVEEDKQLARSNAMHTDGSAEMIQQLKVVPVVVEPDCGKAGSSKSTTTTPKTVTAMPHSQQLRYPLRQRKPLTSRMVVKGFALKQSWSEITTILYSTVKVLANTAN